MNSIKYTISVVIPAYKKTEMFLRNFKHNLPFLAECEIVIVNDDTEKSLGLVLPDAQNIILIENKKNIGFAGTVNKGVQAAQGEYVMLLNTDVLLTNTGYLKALNQFKENPKLFGISFAQREKNGNIVGKNSMYWHDGFFHHTVVENNTPGYTLYAEGGSCMIQTKKFIELGGFDTIYSPFYWEDVDLSYRAWKNGFEVIFAPEIVVDHQHESTISTYFTRKKMNTIAFRNQLFFIWKNIHDATLLKEHYTNLPTQVFKNMIKGNTVYLDGFIQALAKRKVVRKTSTNIKKISIRTDREIFDLFNT